MDISYKINGPNTTKQFIEFLKQSTLTERGPTDDYRCMQGMVENSNLVITAWDNRRLVGIARSMTDFHYACYLSNLAVHRDYQRQELEKSCRL